MPDRVDGFAGAVAVITGGGSGIGEGLAELCHEAGMSVVVGDIETDAARRVADRICGDGGRAIAVPTDVTSRTSVRELADRAYAEFGAVHLLCVNAGVLAMAPLLETPESDLRWMLEVNLLGPVHCAQVFAPRMRGHGGPRHILVTASAAGLYASPDLPIGGYTVSKYAVVGFAETLRGELAADGIGVSVLCPGSVRTRIGDAKRNRPDAFGGPEVAAPVTAGSVVRTVMGAREAARIALDGVRAGRLFILTDADRRPFVEARHRLLMQGFDEVEGVGA